MVGKLNIHTAEGHIVISRRTLIKNIGASALLAQVSSNALAAAIKRTGLKEYYAKDFKIGAAVGGRILGGDQELESLLIREFNSITPENCLKWASLRTADGGWNWHDGDRYVELGTAHHMHVVGHCLAWHSQIPESVFKIAGEYISADELTKKMQEHISAVVGRYKGKINAWDAVNEAIADSDGNPMRPSHYFNILGEKFIDIAFHTAHEVDPACHLIYNDYGTERSGKREACVALLKRLKERGVPVNGVGIQAHLHIDEPDVSEIEKSIIEFSKLGLRVHFTELDIDVLPNVWKIPVADIATRFEYTPERDPYKDGLPAEVEEKLAQRWESLFKLFIKHRDKIERVTTWGISDDGSWLNNFPIRGRTNYPLLFDRKHQPHQAYYKLLALRK